MRNKFFFGAVVGFFVAVVAFLVFLVFAGTVQAAVVTVPHNTVVGQDALVGVVETVGTVKITGVNRVGAVCVGDSVALVAGVMVVPDSVMVV